jgi:hypothetical protein
MGVCAARTWGVCGALDLEGDLAQLGRVHARGHKLHLNNLAAKDVRVLVLAAGRVGKPFILIFCFLKKRINRNSLSSLYPCAQQWNTTRVIMFKKQGARGYHIDARCILFHPSEHCLLLRRWPGSATTMSAVPR